MSTSYHRKYLEAADSVSGVHTVVLSSHDLSLVSSCDRVSSPVLSQQLSDQPFRLLRSVLADTASSHWCREADCGSLYMTARPRGGAARPPHCTAQFRQDAGGLETMF